MTRNQTLVRCLCHRDEPNLQKLLDDSIIQLLLNSDGVRKEDLTDFLNRVRKKLIADRWRAVA